MYHQAIFGISPSERSNLNTVFEANLNSVSGANHTCMIVGISKPKRFMNAPNASAKSNRRGKLFQLLTEKHLAAGCIISQLESEFSEDGLGLVPHVLACINTYSADGNFFSESSDGECLSLLFALARNWKTPEIYQLHQV